MPLLFLALLVHYRVPQMARESVRNAHLRALAHALHVREGGWGGPYFPPTERGGDDDDSATAAEDARGKKQGGQPQLRRQQLDVASLTVDSVSDAHIDAMVAAFLPDDNKKSNRKSSSAAAAVIVGGGPEAAGTGHEPFHPLGGDSSALITPADAAVKVGELQQTREAKLERLLAFARGHLMTPSVTWHGAAARRSPLRRGRFLDLLPLAHLSAHSPAAF